MITKELEALLKRADAGDVDAKTALQYEGPTLARRVIELEKALQLYRDWSRMPAGSKSAKALRDAANNMRAVLAKEIDT